MTLTVCDYSFSHDMFRKNKQTNKQRKKEKKISPCPTCLATSIVQDDESRELDTEGIIRQIEAEENSVGSRGIDGHSLLRQQAVHCVSSYSQDFTTPCSASHRLCQVDSFPFPQQLGARCHCQVRNSNKSKSLDDLRSKDFVLGLINTGT